jgi:hypothetical protein
VHVGGAHLVDSKNDQRSSEHKQAVDDDHDAEDRGVDASLLLLEFPLCPERDPVSSSELTEGGGEAEEKVKEEAPIPYGEAEQVLDVLKR